jgi:diadenosine tetraphosphate (Ap4A) HIT family hydrolase
MGPLVGPLISADEQIVITHRARGSLGYAFIEPRRHVDHLAELTEDEARAIGVLRSRLARALAAELAVQHVHAMVAGLGVPHFHEHVFVRHRGTPADVGWAEPWSEAPVGDIEELVGRLARYFESG